MTENSLNTPVQRLNALADSLKEVFCSQGCQVDKDRGEVILTIPAKELLSVAKTLRDGDAFRFDQLIDLCGVDYGSFGSAEWTTVEASATGFGRGVERGAVDLKEDRRFAVAYQLLSLEFNQRLCLKVFADGEPPIIDSVESVWSSASWAEREAFDLFGILFNGHADLRRILTDYGFIGHPFRKDFPLEGQVEMRYDPSQQRVIYEPISIESRTLVPRVIRDDSRFVATENASQESPDA
jgi:NADH-quinone oxidoreductase subunit C